MMTNNTIEWIELLIKYWDTIKKIPADIWEKVKEAFKKGEKSLGFIRRKDLFLEYYVLSETTFIKKYSRYIIPTEYRGYLLQSIAISRLYAKELNKEADTKRFELIHLNRKAGRLYNLYNSGILFVVFDRIDKMITEGKTEDEITGIASKMIDDFINDKSIIYVHLWHNRNELYQAVKSQLKASKYCLLFASGQDNISKIKRIFSQLVDDPDLPTFTTTVNQRRIGNIDHYSLAVFEQTRIESGEESQ